MISIELLHYLNLDKAEQGDKINQLVKELYDKQVLHGCRELLS